VRIFAELSAVQHVQSSDGQNMPFPRAHQCMVRRINATVVYHRGDGFGVRASIVKLLVATDRGNRVRPAQTIDTQRNHPSAAVLGIVPRDPLRNLRLALYGYEEELHQQYILTQIALAHADNMVRRINARNEVPAA
jgi:hypothetical protein